MQDVLNSLSLLANSIFSQLSNIFSAYTTSVILVFPFGLFFLRKIVNLFRKVF